MESIMRFMQSEEYPVLLKQMQYRVWGKKDTSIQANLKRKLEAEVNAMNDNLASYQPPQRRTGI
jgi:hypothetical protein